MWLDEFYETIMTKLKAEVLDEKNQPIIAHYDIHFGQYELEKDESEDAPEPYPKPAVFFAHQPYDYVQLGGGRKAIDDFMFELHLESEVVQEVDSSTALAIRNRAHKHTQLQAKIEEILQGFNGSQVTDGFKSFGSITCIGGTPYQPFGLSMVHIVRFKTRVTVDTSTKIYKKIKPDTGPTPVKDEITITHITL